MVACISVDHVIMCCCERTNQPQCLERNMRWCVNIQINKSRIQAVRGYLTAGETKQEECHLTANPFQACNTTWIPWISFTVPTSVHSTRWYTPHPVSSPSERQALKTYRVTVLHNLGCSVSKATFWTAPNQTEWWWGVVPKAGSLWPIVVMVAWGCINVASCCFSQWIINGQLKDQQ